MACFSDLHLRGPEDPGQARFCAWLDHAEVDRICLVGDIFDHWWHFGARPFAAYAPVVDRLRGRSLAFLPGNHDFHAASFFSDELGATVGGELRERWDGREVDLLHGDHVDMSAGYRVTARVLRGPAFAAVVDRLGPERAWAFLRRLAGEPGGTPSPRLVAAQIADARRRIAGGVDLVVMGHTHAAGIHGIGRGAFINLGDGLVHQTYVVVDRGLPTMERLGG